MPSLGPAEILVILVVALLVFGPNKMPEIARQVGRGVREFRRVQQHLRSELRDVVSEFDSPLGTQGEAPAGDPPPTLPPLPPSAGTVAAGTDAVGADAAGTDADGAAPAPAPAPGDDQPAPPAPGD
jgi:sec-independent protein translocase protein TatA